MPHKIVPPPGVRRERGMLLVECLVYMALLTVVLALAYAAYYRCAENSKRLGQNVDDVLRALQAGERWRDDIRAAMAITSAEDSLRLVQSNATVDYVFVRGAVWRRAGASAPLAPFLPGVKSSRMERDARREVAAWRWEVELSARGAAARGNVGKRVESERWEVESGARGATARFRPFFTFEAVARGDRTR